MWNWFNCYLSGRHQYGKWCEPGAIFLRCVHCGRRSPGWTLEGKSTAPVIYPKAKKADATGTNGTRVVPFNRSAAR
ncbi:MAG: hypothetical protein A3H97_08040 [Acidobacteria bacterium RIFCSPLOWO2_02_FULL_65_29]|nr:MAG: hypothetical protein A3H97_08040 [Acidobacteria bacterium RIFCSPLOWO2_02_FULL_65_29]